MLLDEYDATIKSEMTVCVCDENVLDDFELYSISSTLTGCGHDVLQPFDTKTKEKRIVFFGR